LAVLSFFFGFVFLLAEKRNQIVVRLMRDLGKSRLLSLGWSFFARPCEK